MLFAQTVFIENFESTPINMVSSTSGTGGWGINSRVQSQGLKSDSAQVALLSTIYLTTDSFSTIGKYSVYLDFDQVCKVDYYDSAYVEYSTDSISWQRLVGGYYEGSGGFVNIGNRFFAGSYVSWGIQDTTQVPVNSWWKHERFNLSTLVPNQAHVWVRFVLKDGYLNTTPDGSAGFPGWYIDSVKVTASVSEIQPPTLTMLAPIIQDTAYSAGPYNIGASVSDASGIDTVFCAYEVNPGNFIDTIPMILDANTVDSFYCNIPFYGFGRTISYKVLAYDASFSNNLAQSPTYNFFCKNSPGGTFDVGNGTASFSSTSSNPFGQYYTGNKNQFLILASELQALGATGGNIFSIAFDVVTANSATTNGSNHDGFTVKIKSTSASALSTTFETGLTQVYSTTTYQTIVGWNTFTFTSPYSWDGNSNIIIETCFDNGTSNYSSNAAIHTTTTSFYSVTNKYSDASTNECIQTTGSTYSTRPNMQVVIATPSAISNDIGVLSILNPTTGVISGNSFNIDVNVKNFGGDTVTTSWINWTYDDTLQTPYHVTDSLFADSITSALTLGSKTATVGAHYIVAWTDSVNGSFDNDISNDTASYSFYGCSSLLSGAYTIGGTGADYADFYEAILALNQCGINGAVTFNVAAGTYNEQIELLPINGASSTNTVLFQSVNGDSTTVILSHDALNANDNYVIEFDGVAYCTFKGMTIVAQDASFARAVVLKGTSHDITFANNIIKSTHKSSSDDDQMALIFGADSLGSNISVINNVIQNGSWGIALVGNQSASNWIFQGNYIHGHYSKGISARNTSSISVNSNDIMPDSASQFGPYNAIELTDNSGSALIMKNKIMSHATSYANGIYVSSSTFDASNHSMIANNLVQLNGTSTSFISVGIMLHESKYISVYYNNVRLSGNQNTAALSLYDASASITDHINIVNNIFTNNGGGYIYYVNNVDTSKFNNYRNNLYDYGMSTNYARLGGLNIASYTDWLTKTAAVGCDTVIPYFYSATDLHVANNSLSGRAIPISGIFDDVDGDTRDATNPDWGADEFIPSPYDVTALEVLSPIGACGLDSNEIVIVKFKNLGSATINGNFTANYRTKGGITISENISDSIVVGDTLTYYFTTPINLSVASYGQDSTFDLSVWGSLQGDNIQLNDTAFTSVVSSYQPPSPVTADVTINYGASTVLTATANDSLTWWATDTSTVELSISNSYTTPVLYDTITYWVSAKAVGGGSPILITECNLGGTDHIEIQNMSSSSFDATGWKVVVSDNYTNTNTSNSTVWNLGVMAANVVMWKDDNYSSGVNYWGNNIFWNNGNNGWAMIIDDLGEIRDFLAWGWTSSQLQSMSVSTSGFTGLNPMTSLIPQWNGDGVPSSCYSTIYRQNYDLNNLTDWTCQINTKGVANVMSNVGGAGGGSSCESVRIPLTVNVIGIPSADLGVTSLISPITQIDLTATEFIKVRFKNYGTLVQDTIPIAYQIDNNPMVIDTFYGTMPSGVDTLFTFSIPANLAVYKTYTIKVFTKFSTDTIYVNDTTLSFITNIPLVYCASSATSTADSRIDEVVFGNINNNTASMGCATYTDFTNLSTIIQPGHSYPISVTLGTCGGNYTKGVKAFIDFNHDGDFDDPGEEAANFGQGSPTTTYTAMINVPANAVVSMARMRIVGRESAGVNNASILPCGNYTYGETEDYIVQIVPNIPNDAGVYSIITPTAVENESASIPVKVAIQNYGTDTIFAMSVNYSIDNGTAVSFNYTNTLAPMGVDTILLPNMSVPAGFYSLCAYTVLTGDSAVYNDSTCITLFGTPVKDAYLTRIENFNYGCRLGQDTVKIWIKNLGVDTINGNTPTNMQAKFQIQGSPTIVSENMNLQINPGDSALFSFAGLADFTNTTTMDSVFMLNAWVDLVGDNVSYNDSASQHTTSLHTPTNPIISSPQVITYATSDTLFAVSPIVTDPLKWYSDSMGFNTISLINYYVTPLMFNDDTVYVEAYSNVGCHSDMMPFVINVSAQVSCDLSASAITQPVSAPNLGNAITISVKVKNYGTASQNNIPIYYQIDNGTVVSETISSSILPGDSLVYNFNTTANLGVYGKFYNIKAYTALTCDAVLLNDTVETTVQNMYFPYCVSMATSTADSKIDAVSLSTMYNNTSTACVGYSDFTNDPNLTVFLAQGSNYTLSVTTGSCGGNYNKGTKAWIDYNRDGDFNDMGEYIANFGSGNSGTYSASFTVPNNTIVGKTTMRIVSRESPGTNNVNVSSCGTYSWGETEDYIVVLAPKIPQDAGVEKILNLPTMVSSASKPLMVRVRNYGTDTIQALDVTYQVNNGAPVTTSLGSVSLAPNATVDVSLGNVPLQQGANNVCAYTTVVNDSNTFNDQKCQSVFREAVVILTYTDDFESNNIWMADTVANQWERGMPAMTNINVAHSPVNVWGINLSGNYDNNSDDYLYSPKMVITGLDSALLRFWHYYNTESYDGCIVEVAMNNGTWLTLGVINDANGSNWYNTTIGGTPTWSGNSAGWIESTYSIDFSLFMPGGSPSPDTVQFRYHFHSNSYGNSKDGWAIDDFSLELPQVNIDGGVISINSPGAATPVGSPVTVDVMVKNLGLTPLTTIPVTYTIGSNTVSEVINIATPGLMPGAVINHTFSTSYIGPGAAYMICAETNILGDPYEQNDSVCKMVATSQAPFDVKVFDITIGPSWGDTLKITYDDTITMHIVNVGVNTINTMTLAYKIGSNQKTPINWTGSLASGDTLHYTFNQSFHSPISWVPICAKATIVNDADLTNNEFCHNYFSLNDLGLDAKVVSLFSVEQSAPNPASSGVAIKYHIPQAGSIHFELRNTMGQLIVSDDFDRNEGDQTISLDASNLASGIYYYTVEFNHERITKKMIVNK